MLLGGSALLVNTSDYSHASTGVATLTHFEAILKVTKALSEERDPAAALMGASADEEAETKAALTQKRAAVDTSIAEIKQRLAPQIQANPDLRRGLDGLDFVLTMSRQSVDAIAAEPLDQRSAPDMARAIDAIFAVGDAAAVLRSGIGRQIMRTSPQITTELMLWTAANEMREQQGRLGAYVLLMLASNPAQDQRYISKFNEIETKLRLLRNILNNYTTAYLASAELPAQLKLVDDDYFGRALTYARMTARLHESTGPISPVAFTNKYLLGVTSTDELLNMIVAQSLQRLDTMRDEAAAAVIRAGVLTGMIVLALLGLVMVFRRILFQPLTIVHAQLMAVAHGDLSEPPAMRPIGREIREMLSGVATLRNHQREKLRLEKEQRRMTERLKALADTDTLTGLPNRRALRDFAQGVFAQADADNHTVGVIIFDVDHFKAVNDTLGHSMGDIVLQKIGKILPPLLRSNDIMARYGGEEFVILLRNTDQTRAFAIAERLRVTLSRTPVSRKNNLKVTASFGVALRDPRSDENWDAVVAIADRRLYAAKRAGRNLVCITDPEEPRVVAI